MHLTPEQKIEYDADQAKYKKMHPNCEAHRWSVSGARAMHCGYCCPPLPMPPGATRAGLDGLHFYELRHTFATLALESRALDMHELSRAMGHASYAITDKVYAHVRSRDFSVHRAAFSAHISVANPMPTPVQLHPAAG